MQVAPHVHTSRKSLGGEGFEQRAIAQCIRAAHGSGVDRLLPVIWHGRTIAWVGELLGRGSPVSVLRHSRALERKIDDNGFIFGYANVDDVIAQATTTGQFFHSPWSKTLGSGPGTHWTHLWALQGTHCGLWDGTAYTGKDRSDATLGALPHGGNVSTKTKYILNGSVALGSAPTVTDGEVYIPYDLVRSYDACATVASTQTFTNSGTAPRYCGVGDPGLDIMAVTSGINGNVTYNTVLYTSDTGTAGQTADSSGIATVFTSAAPTVIDQWPSGFEYSGGPSILKLGLAAGDNGARQIDSIAWGATGSTVGMILGHLYAWMPTFQSGYVWLYDFVKQINCLPVVKDGACITMAKFEFSLSHINNGHFDFGWV